VEEGTYYQSNFWAPKDTDERGPDNSFQRIKHVLCYDKIMAMYIIVFIGWVVWLSIGISRRLSNNDGGCEDQVYYMTVSIVCGYMYLSLVGVAFLLSLCCFKLTHA
jgi:hypothetical protein